MLPPVCSVLSYHAFSMEKLSGGSIDLLNTRTLRIQAGKQKMVAITIAGIVASALAQDIAAMVALMRRLVVVSLYRSHKPFIPVFEVLTHTISLN